MGRLSEYVNSSSSSRSRSTKSADGSVEVYGFTENSEMLAHLLTTDPTFEKNFRKFIRTVLKEARGKLSKDAKNYLKSDPRKAARAVKHSVYKALFGGNISILQKRSHGAFSNYVRPHTLRPGQRGGNRRPRNEKINRLDKYQGADRGFILRFISSGTVQRQTRFGNRGNIRASDWFGRTAPWHIEQAAADVAAALTEYIKQETNG